MILILAPSALPTRGRLELAPTKVGDGDAPTYAGISKLD